MSKKLLSFLCMSLLFLDAPVFSMSGEDSLEEMPSDFSKNYGRSLKEDKNLAYIDHLRSAAVEKGDPIAATKFVNSCLKEGWEDDEGAVKLFNQAVKEIRHGAVKEVFAKKLVLDALDRSQIPGADQIAAQLLHEACSSETPEANFFFALMHLYGIGVSQDSTRAVQLLKKTAVDQGYQRAQHFLMYMDMKHAEKITDQATMKVIKFDFWKNHILPLRKIQEELEFRAGNPNLKYFLRRSIFYQSPYQYRDLALNFEMGCGVVQDSEKAQFLYRISRDLLFLYAEKCENVGSRLQLGLMRAQGLGIPKEKRKDQLDGSSIRHLRIAVNKGHPDAPAYLAGMYMQGRIRDSKSPAEEAINLLKIAVTHGNLYAEEVLMCMGKSEHSAEHDKDTEKFLETRSRCSLKTILELAQYYRDKKTADHTKKAVHLLYFAAHMGDDPRAKVDLASMYLQGCTMDTQNIPPEEDKGAPERLYLLAARSGSMDALTYLGEMVYRMSRSRYVTSSTFLNESQFYTCLNEARRLLSFPAKNGHQLAQFHLGHLDIFGNNFPNIEIFHARGKGEHGIGELLIEPSKRQVEKAKYDLRALGVLRFFTKFTTVRRELEVLQIHKGGPNIDRGMDLLRLAASQKNTDAQITLARLYSDHPMNPSPIPRNMQEAIRYFHLAADTGSVLAHTVLGLTYLGIDNNYILIEDPTAPFLDRGKGLNHLIHAAKAQEDCKIKSSEPSVLARNYKAKLDLKKALEDLDLEETRSILSILLGNNEESDSFDVSDEESDVVDAKEHYHTSDDE